MDELNWKKAVDEMVSNLVRLIRINTTNPPGNELPAILAIKEILEADGIPSADIHILESAPGRANLVMRLKGDGSLRPLLLSGHVDVVPVEREYWSHDPFSGEIENDIIWGRGTFDMKGVVAMYLQVFLMVRRAKIPLKRDLIFAAVADEEALCSLGSKYLVDQHGDLIDAEYGFTEMGGMTTYLGGIKLYPIQVAEKRVWTIKMHTHGQPGHGAIPHQDNAILHLSGALNKLKQARQLPVHLTPPFRRMLDAIGQQKGFPINLVTGFMSTPFGARLFLRMVSGSTRDTLASMITNTVAPTMLKAGAKDNVIPSEAEVTMNCRLLPGQSPEDLYREIKSITGDGVEFEHIISTNGAQFSPDTDMFQRLVRATQKMDPTGLVVPYLTAVATDANEYQRAGVTVYGFTPGMLPPEFPVAKLPHGHDERLPISYFETGLPVLWEVVSESCLG